jgi:excisionase family DNA binding protein
MSAPVATDRFVSPSQAARLIGRSTRTIYRAVAAGRLAALRWGDAPNAPIRIRASDLAEQLRLVVPNQEHE